jgi:hypothetical protein
MRQTQHQGHRLNRRFNEAVRKVKLLIQRMDKQGRSHASVHQPPDGPKQPPARVQAFAGLAIGALPTIKKRFTLYYMQHVREGIFHA